MTLHKDTIVQLTHDIQRHDFLIKHGTAGLVLFKAPFRRTCTVEFTVERQTIVAKVDDHDLVEVQPNARV